MTISSELSARIILARIISRDFTVTVSAAMQPQSDQPDWLEWAHRINSALVGLSSALDDSLRVTSAVLPDNSALVSARDMLTVIGALNDGATYAAERGNYLDATRYRALSRALGDDR